MNQGKLTDDNELNFLADSQPTTRGLQGLLHRTGGSVVVMNGARPGKIWRCVKATCVNACSKVYHTTDLNTQLFHSATGPHKRAGIKLILFFFAGVNFRVQQDLISHGTPTRDSSRFLSFCRTPFQLTEFVYALNVVIDVYSSNKRRSSPMCLRARRLRRSRRRGPKLPVVGGIKSS